MSPDERDFERFSHDLDEEWLRNRLRAGAPTLIEAAEEEEFARVLGREDPLGQPAQPGWLVVLREALSAWPGRVAFTASACALVLIGFALGRVPAGKPDTRMAVAVVPKPIYQPEAAPRLGIVAAVKPESERKFREAMAFYAATDFPRKALPLLREAVSQDASNDEAQFWLGVVLLLGGKDAEAIGPLQQAVETAPASVAYKQYLIFTYLRVGAVDRALALQAELLKPR